MYDRSSSKNIYLNVAVNTLKKLRSRSSTCASPVTSRRLWRALVVLRRRVCAFPLVNRNLLRRGTGLCGQQEGSVSPAGSRGSSCCHHQLHCQQDGQTAGGEAHRYGPGFLSNTGLLRAAAAGPSRPLCLLVSAGLFAISFFHPCPQHLLSLCQMKDM